MYLTASQTADLGHLFGVLQEDARDDALRLEVGRLLLRLTGADYFASYVWSEAAGAFADPVQIGMDPANLDRYAAWYQYRDPITHRLKARAAPTLVSAVMPRPLFLKTEFYNDFLARDGLAYGVNAFCVDRAGRHVGDLRVWRSARQGEFDGEVLELLGLIRPALTAALARRRAGASAPPDAAGLTPREAEIGALIAAGASDKEIARALGLAPTTVRTHVGRLFEKLGVGRRAGIAAALAARRRGP